MAESINIHCSLIDSPVTLTIVRLRVPTSGISDSRTFFQLRSVAASRGLVHAFGVSCARAGLKIRSATESEGHRPVDDFNTEAGDSIPPR
jgi:hypothetical protein